MALYVFPLWEIPWCLSIVFSHNGKGANVSFYIVDFQGIIDLLQETV